MLTTIHARATVASNGTVTVPVGTQDAGVEVEVTVTPVRPSGDMTQERWVELINRTAGSIDDSTFVRPEQPPVSPIQGLD